MQYLTGLYRVPTAQSNTLANTDQTSLVLIGQQPHRHRTPVEIPTPKDDVKLPLYIIRQLIHLACAATESLTKTVQLWSQPVMWLKTRALNPAPSASHVWTWLLKPWPLPASSEVKPDPYPLLHKCCVAPGAFQSLVDCSCRSNSLNGFSTGAFSYRSSY